MPGTTLVKLLSRTLQLEGAEGARNRGTPRGENGPKKEEKKLSTVREKTTAKKIPLVMLSLLILSSILWLTTSAEVNDGNEATAQLCTGSSWGTEEDIIENVEVPCECGWLFQICNHIDGTGEPVNDPKITIETEMEFARLWPEPTYEDPPIYTWDFTGISVPEGIHIHASAIETFEPTWLKPGFTATRSVSPEILVEPVTIQTVVVTLILADRPAEFEGMFLTVSIGPPTSVLDEYMMIDTTVSSWESVADWDDRQLRANCIFYYETSVETGKPYTFSVTFETMKSEQLFGSPTFKPNVNIYYEGGPYIEPETGKSITVVREDITATFEASNDIHWGPSTTDSWHFTFNQVVTDYIVLATIDIDQNTLNLDSKGKWITAYIELPEICPLEDIDIETIALHYGEDEVPVEWGEIQEDVLMVKFDRCEVVDMLDQGDEVELTVRGELPDGIPFEGSDTIQVLENK